MKKKLSQKWLVKYDIAQGLKLGPILIIFYVNYTVEKIKESSCNYKLFAIDTIFYLCNYSMKDIEKTLNNGLKILCESLNHNSLINFKKTFL